MCVASCSLFLLPFEVREAIDSKGIKEDARKKYNQYIFLLWSAVIVKWVKIYIKKRDVYSLWCALLSFSGFEQMRRKMKKKEMKTKRTEK